MPDVPRYPAGSGPGAIPDPDQQRDPRSRRSTYLWWVVGVGVVVVFVVLHLTGVLGAGQH
jgi:hypothetical protein